MKISFECDCILLQNSLRLFLKDYASHRKDCDFIISDRKIESKKHVFVIAKDSAHLQIPFSKETLLSALEEFYSAIQISNAPAAQKIDSSHLEQDISLLIDKFKTDLIDIIRRHG